MRKILTSLLFVLSVHPFKGEITDYESDSLKSVVVDTIPYILFKIDSFIGEIELISDNLYTELYKCFYE